MHRISAFLPLLQFHALRLHPLSPEKQLPMFLHQPGGLPLQGLFIQRRSSPPQGNSIYFFAKRLTPMLY